MHDTQTTLFWEDSAQAKLRVREQSPNFTDVYFLSPDGLSAGAHSKHAGKEGARVSSSTTHTRDPVASYGWLRCYLGPIAASSSTKKESMPVPAPTIHGQQNVAVQHLGPAAPGSCKLWNPDERNQPSLHQSLHCTNWRAVGLHLVWRTPQCSPASGLSR